MHIRTNVRFTSRQKTWLFPNKFQALANGAEVVDDSLDIFKETAGRENSDRCMVSYLVENLRGIREEITLSPQPRRICPITGHGYEE